MALTTKELMECFINPNKSSILLTIQQLGTCTAKELMAQQPDIPQATLYRTLNQLTKKGILKVVSEKKVRAVVEKTYGLNDSFGLNIEAMLHENNGPAYFQLMSSFTLQLMAEFKTYSERPSIDIIHDGSGFSATPIYVNEEEIKDLAQEVANVVKPYQTKSTDPETQQTLHTMAVIFTPPQSSSQKNSE